MVSIRRLWEDLRQSILESLVTASVEAEMAMRGFKPGSVEYEGAMVAARATAGASEVRGNDRVQAAQDAADAALGRLNARVDEQLGFVEDLEGFVEEFDPVSDVAGAAAQSAGVDNSDQYAMDFASAMEEESAKGPTELPTELIKGGVSGTFSAAAAGMIGQKTEKLAPWLMKLLASSDEQLAAIRETGVFA